MGNNTDNQFKIFVFDRDNIPKKLEKEVEQILERAGKAELKKVLKQQSPKVMVMTFQGNPIAAAETYSRKNHLGKTMKILNRISRKEDAYETIRKKGLTIPHSIGVELLHHICQDKKEFSIIGFSNKGLEFLSQFEKIPRRPLDTFKPKPVAPFSKTATWRKRRA